MNTLLITIVRFVDDSQPGWVECTLADAYGGYYVFNEKAPIVSKESLDKNSRYPRIGMLECEVIERWKTDKGRALVKVDTGGSNVSDANNGISVFDVLQRQIM